MECLFRYHHTWRKFELEGGPTHFLEGRMDASFGTDPLAMSKAIRLMETGLINTERIISHCFPLEQMQQRSRSWDRRIATDYHQPMKAITEYRRRSIRMAELPVTGTACRAGTDSLRCGGDLRHRPGDDCRMGTHHTTEYTWA